MKAAMSRQRWSRWTPFPDPRIQGILCAPFGPGVYELRRRDDESLILVGQGKNVALRMTSLLPEPLGQGTRANEAKRQYVLDHLSKVQYRFRACVDEQEAEDLEEELRSKRQYLFPT